MDKTGIVWVTGGDIGRTLLVQQLCDQEWKTIAIAWNESNLESITQYVLEVDVSDPRQVQTAVYSSAMEFDSANLQI